MSSILLKDNLILEILLSNTYSVINETFNESKFSRVASNIALSNYSSI